MSDEDRPEDESTPSTPAQIPLLDDIVPERQPRRRRQPKRENLDLDLDPAPPETGDLFADTSASESISPPEPVEASPSPVRHDNELRQRADDVLERLVHEYAREMVSRLRKELTQVLEELDPPDEADVTAVWDGPPVSAWNPWFPVEVWQRFRDSGADWHIAGGWAMDLFLGERTRRHDDIEIALPRGDFSRLARRLGDCDLFAAGRNETRRLRPGEPPPETIHQVWVVARGDPSWRLDILLEPGDHDTWVYRRDPGITRPRTDVVLRRNDIPYLSPEAVLLYKTKATRDKDQLDFDYCVSRLDPPRRQWLAGTIKGVAPGHPWLTVLRAGL